MKQVYLKNLIKKLIPNLYVLEKIKVQSFLLNLFGYEKILRNILKKIISQTLKNIKILPMTFNLKKFYSKIDIMLFPGYMNAVDRPVIEAFLLKKPSIIALNSYNNDTAKKNNCLIFRPGDLFLLEK